MAIHSGITVTLQFFRRAIYHPLLAPIAHRIGIHTHLARVYWRVLLAFNQEQTATVRSTSATFRVKSRAEYRRTKDFVGEKAVLADFLDELSPGDVFYDIGANIGLYSCFALGQLSEGEGQVIAFEPHPQTADRLRTNLSINSDQYDVYEYALADSSDKMNLSSPVGKDRPGTYQLQDTEEDDGISVEVIRGDDLRKRASIPVPTILKIDVEGAELDVIDGLAETLSQESCRLVYVEIHQAVLRERNASQAIVESRLKAFGFSVSELYSRNSEIFLKAEREDSSRPLTH